MASVHDVAAYILDKRGPMSHMKLQKLVYYCQAWSLVWDEELFFFAIVTPSFPFLVAKVPSCYIDDFECAPTAPFGLQLQPSPECRP